MTYSTARMKTQEVDVEAFIKFDGTSKPSYDARGSIDARVVRTDDVVKRSDGTEVRTQYTVHVDGSESYMPLWHDRLAFTTLGENHTAIVEERVEGRTLSGTVSHVRLKCREE